MRKYFSVAHQALENNKPVAYSHPIYLLPRLLPMLSDPFNPRIIYITDGIAPNELDSFPRPVTRYIPLWTLDEYFQASSLYSKTPEYIKEAYSIAGGSARLVFQSDSIEILKKILLQAVNRTNIDECWKAIESVGNTSLPLSNFFNSTNEVLNQIGEQLYEAYIIQSFLQSKYFKIISKVNKSIKTLRTPGGSVTFSTIDECSSSDMLYVPISESFASIDFLLTPCYLFQITKAKDHKALPASDIQQYVKKLQTIHTPFNFDPLDIYLISVVPSNKIEFQNTLNYKDLSCPFQEFESNNRVTQWMCIMPYPTILDLKKLVEPKTGRSTKS
eukprot:gene6026-7510_t